MMVKPIGVFTKKLSFHYTEKKNLSIKEKCGHKSPHFSTFITKYSCGQTRAILNAPHPFRVGHNFFFFAIKNMYSTFNILLFNISNQYKCLTL